MSEQIGEMILIRIFFTILTVGVITLTRPATIHATGHHTSTDAAVETLLAHATTFDAGDPELRRFLTIPAEAIRNRAQAHDASTEQKEAWLALTYGVVEPAQDLLYRSYIKGNTAPVRATAGLHLAALELLKKGTPPERFLRQSLTLNPALAEAWIQSVRWSLAKNDAEETAELTVEAINALTASSSHPLLARILILGSVAQKRLGNFQIAEKWLSKALNIGQKLDQQAIQSRAHLQLALLWLDMDNMEKAKLHLAFPAQTPELQAAYKIAGGRYEIMQDRSVSGIAKVRNGLAYFRSSGNLSATASAHIELARAFVKTGDVSSAKQELAAAQKIAVKAFDDLKKGQILALRGDLHSLTNRPRQACNFWRRARLDLIKTRNKFAEQEVMAKIRDQKCVETEGDALLGEIVKLMPSDTVRKNTHRHEIPKRNYSYDKKEGEDFDFYRKVLVKLKRNRTNPYLWDHYAYFLYNELRNLPGAVSAYSNTLTFGRPVNDVKLIPFAELQLFRIYTELGETEKADEYYRKLADRYNWPHNRFDFEHNYVFVFADMSRADQAWGAGDLIREAEHLRRGLKLARAQNYREFRVQYSYRIGRNKQILGSKQDPELIELFTLSPKLMPWSNRSKTAGDALRRTGYVLQANNQHSNACRTWEAAQKHFNTKETSNYFNYMDSVIERAGCR